MKLNTFLFVEQQDFFFLYLCFGDKTHRFFKGKRNEILLEKQRNYSFTAQKHQKVDFIRFCYIFEDRKKRGENWNICMLQKHFKSKS